MARIVQGPARQHVQRCWNCGALNSRPTRMAGKYPCDKCREVNRPTRSGGGPVAQAAERARSVVVAGQRVQPTAVTAAAARRPQGRPRPGQQPRLVPAPPKVPRAGRP